MPGLGFGFQDRGEMFNVMNRSHANAYEPGKRPFHTIIPAFAMKDDKPWLSFGVMGGDMFVESQPALMVPEPKDDMFRFVCLADMFYDRQPQGHVQIIVNMVDFGMNVQEAGDAARYGQHHDGSPADDHVELRSEKSTATTRSASSWHHTSDSEPTGYVMEDGGELYLERGVCEETRAALAARGHDVRSGGDYGGYQAIMRENLEDGTFVYRAASEMRKDGQAVGY